MTEPFIPGQSRPQVAASLAREAWAVAALLEDQVKEVEPADGKRDVPGHELEPVSGDLQAPSTRSDPPSRQHDSRPLPVLPLPSGRGSHRGQADGVLLVLAQPNDETARRFVDFAVASGVDCAMPRFASELELSVEVERDGSTTVDIRIVEGRTRVGSVLNRGLPDFDGPTEADEFRSAETLASWWAALALFPGPVINRPSETGFFPDLSVPSVVRMATGFRPALIRIGNQPPWWPDEPRVNLHCLRTGEYRGYLCPEREPSVDDEILVFTGFDPARTVQLLLAGGRAFNLSSDLGHLSPSLDRRLSALTRRLRALDATFSLLVVQPDDDAIRVVQATPFPTIHQYERIAAAVHHGLLESLLG